MELSSVVQTPFSGNILRDIRMQRGESVAGVSRATGLSVRTIYNFERGRGRARPQTLYLLHDHYEVITSHKLTKFSIVLRQVRKRALETQEQLALATGIPLSCITHYENGRRHPNPNTAYKLFQHYPASMEWLEDAYRSSVIRGPNVIFPTPYARTLRTIRGQIDKTQKQLADDAGLYERTIVNAERGVRISLDSHQKIVHCLFTFSDVLDKAYQDSYG